MDFTPEQLRQVREIAAQAAREAAEYAMEALRAEMSEQLGAQGGAAEFDSGLPRMPEYHQDIQRGGVPEGEGYVHPPTVEETVLTHAKLDALEGGSEGDRALTFERKTLEVHSSAPASNIQIALADLVGDLAVHGIDETVLTGVESKIPTGGSEEDRVLEFSRKVLTVLDSAEATPVSISVADLIREIVKQIPDELPTETVWVLRKATSADVALDSSLVVGQWLCSKRSVYCAAETEFEKTVPHACPEYEV